MGVFPCLQVCIILHGGAMCRTPRRSYGPIYVVPCLQVVIIIIIVRTILMIITIIIIIIITTTIIIIITITIILVLVLRRWAQYPSGGPAGKTLHRPWWRRLRGPSAGSARLGPSPEEQ